jgi:AmmeMemoRadiSam system protein A
MSSTETGALSEDLRKRLMDVARDSIAHGFRAHTPLPVEPAEFPPPLREPRATFVTLMLHSELRGCIGNLEPQRPLVEDVAANAFAAAFHDPRFVPLTEEEYPELNIRISILSPNTEIPFRSEDELLRQLRPRVDGLVIQLGIHRATFLPSVWESLPRTEDFLEHLKHKAGIHPGDDLRGLKAWRYATESFSGPC